MFVSSTHQRIFRALCACVLIAASEVAIAQGSSQPSKPVKVPKGTAPPRQPSATPAQDPTTGKPPAAPTASGVVEFSGETAGIEEIALTLPVPAHALAVRNIQPPSPDHPEATPQTVLQIIPENQAWRVLVRAPHVADAALTIRESADFALRQLQDRAGIPDSLPDAKGPKDGPKYTAVRVLERVPSEKDPRKRIVGSGDRQFECERWYAALPQGKGQPDLVRGFTVAKISDSQFLIFELTTTDKDFAATRPIYETLVSAARLGDPQDVSARRAMAVDAGMRAIRAVSDKDLEAIASAHPERWFRFYKPSPSGRKEDDTELGYMRVQAKVGQRGLVDRDKSKGAWGPAERETGYVILTDMRLLRDAEIIDSQAGYFLRKDRGGEFWTISSGVRTLDAKGQKGAKPAVYTEIGARNALSMQVTITGTGVPDTDIKPVIQSDAYVSRVEALLMPQILIRGRAAAEFGCYTWVSELGKIRFRRDLLEHAAGGSGWQITTRFGDDPQNQTSVYRDDGELVRTTMPDGTIREPVAPEELVRIWSSKKLPMN